MVHESLCHEGRRKGLVGHGASTPACCNNILKLVVQREVHIRWDEMISYVFAGVKVLRER